MSYDTPYTFGLQPFLLYRASNDEVWRIGYAWPSTKQKPVYEWTSENYDGPEDHYGAGVTTGALEKVIEDIEERVADGIEELKEKR